MTRSYTLLHVFKGKRYFEERGSNNLVIFGSGTNHLFLKKPILLHVITCYDTFLLVQVIMLFSFFFNISGKNDFYEHAAALLFQCMKDHKEQEPIRLMMLNKTRLLRSELNHEGVDASSIAIKAGLHLSARSKRPKRPIVFKTIGSRFSLCNLHLGGAKDKRA